MRMLAEVIARALSGGLSWRGSLAGKEVYCPPPGLNGHEIMVALEKFLEENPDMAERPYRRCTGADVQPDVSMPTDMSNPRGASPETATSQCRNVRPAGSSRQSLHPIVPDQHIREPLVEIAR
jgi:hypothetical protein